MLALVVIAEMLRHGLQVLRGRISREWAEDGGDQGWGIDGRVLRVAFDGLLCRSWSSSNRRYCCQLQERATSLDLRSSMI